MRNCKKNEQEQHGLGRSCGGFSTKIHGVCDALGLPIHFTITPGQASDYTQAIACIGGFTYKALLADKGYDSNDLRQYVVDQGSVPVIPARKNRLDPMQHDAHLYKERREHPRVYTRGISSALPSTSCACPNVFG